MTRIYTDPAELRLASRHGEFRQATSGHAPGRLQANLVIVPQANALDFMLFAQRNPKPCPLIEVLDAGQLDRKSVV